MKIVLVEGAGRYSLSTGRTIFEGWRCLGAWTTWYFAPYIVVWGFVYGATAMTATALPLSASPAALDASSGIPSGLVGLVLVWFGRYAVFEKVMTALVGIMFVAVVGAALLTLPNLGEMLAGLAPRIPDGGLVNTLALAGGVGGTITLAAYGYWLREKGWPSRPTCGSCASTTASPTSSPASSCWRCSSSAPSCSTPPARPRHRRRRLLRPRRRAAGPVRQCRRPLPGRLLGDRVLLAHRCVERRQPDGRRLRREPARRTRDDARASAGRGPARTSSG